MQDSMKPKEFISRLQHVVGEEGVILNPADSGAVLADIQQAARAVGRYFPFWSHRRRKLALQRVGAVRSFSLVLQRDNH
jgi:hypothetical protein